jgi:hypothetical protein
VKTQQVLLTTSLLAVAALSVRRFAGIDGNPCAAGAKPLGVTELDTDPGNMAPVNVLGIVLVEAGAAIAQGAEVQSDGTSRAITKAAGASAGTALDAASAAGEVIRIVRGI